MSKKPIKEAVIPTYPTQPVPGQQPIPDILIEAQAQVLKVINASAERLLAHMATCKLEKVYDLVNVTKIMGIMFDKVFEIFRLEASWLYGKPEQVQYIRTDIRDKETKAVRKANTKSMMKQLGEMRGSLDKLRGVVEPVLPIEPEIEEPLDADEENAHAEPVVEPVAEPMAEPVVGDGADGDDSLA